MFTVCRASYSKIVQNDITEYKCINCETHNRHNPTKEISADHSALDKGCPSLQAVLERNREILNTNERLADSGK
jgi:hypothetical protein